MRIHLQLGALVSGLLFLSFAGINSAFTFSEATDTTVKESTESNTSFMAAVRPLTRRFYPVADLEQMMLRGQAAGIELGISREGRTVNAWYFPGTSDKKALVIGGVHGSELSSIEVAEALVEKLMTQEEKTFYHVIVIPTLFPDNAAAAMREPGQLGSVLNIGRYTHENAVDPNRQMPSPGEEFDEDEQRDHLARTIEKENQFLLQLINAYKPERIASLHAIRNTNYGGIYADPRTDADGIALGYASDSSLAVDMAIMVRQHRGNVAGNHLADRPTALYYKDPVPAAKGTLQKRNTTGAALKGNRGSGISMGTWGTTAIEDAADSAQNRNAMRVITIEVPGARRSIDYKTDKEQAFFRGQMLAFVKAIHGVFLGEKYPED
jgi:hypothetical protein